MAGTSEDEFGVDDDVTESGDNQTTAGTSEDELGVDYDVTESDGNSSESVDTNVPECPAKGSGAEDAAPCAVGIDMSCNHKSDEGNIEKTNRHARSHVPRHPRSTGFFLRARPEKKDMDRESKQLRGKHGVKAKTLEGPRANRQSYRRGRWCGEDRRRRSQSRTRRRAGQLKRSRGESSLSRCRGRRRRQGRLSRSRSSRRRQAGHSRGSEGEGWSQNKRARQTKAPNWHQREADSGRCNARPCSLRSNSWQRRQQGKTEARPVALLPNLGNAQRKEQEEPEIVLDQQGNQSSCRLIPRVHWRRVHKAALYSASAKVWETEAPQKLLDDVGRGFGFPIKELFWDKGIQHASARNIQLMQSMISNKKMACLISSMPEDPSLTAASLASGSANLSSDYMPTSDKWVFIKDLATRHRGELREVCGSWVLKEGPPPKEHCYYHPQFEHQNRGDMPASGGHRPRKPWATDADLRSKGLVNTVLRLSEPGVEDSCDTVINARPAAGGHFVRHGTVFGLMDLFHAFGDQYTAKDLYAYYMSRLILAHKRLHGQSSRRAAGWGKH